GLAHRFRKSTGGNSRLTDYSVARRPGRRPDSALARLRQHGGAAAQVHHLRRQQQPAAAPADHHRWQRYGSASGAYAGSALGDLGFRSQPAGNRYTAAQPRIATRPWWQRPSRIAAPYYRDDRHRTSGRGVLG